MPCIPLFVELLDTKYPKGDEMVKGDFGSSLYTTGFTVGEFFGPILGGILTKYLLF